MIGWDNWIDTAMDFPYFWLASHGYPFAEQSHLRNFSSPMELL